MIGRHNEAMDYTKKSIIMLKNIGDKEGIAYQYYHMTTIYSKLGHYDNALKYINLSKKHIFNNTEIDLERKRALEFEIYQICSYRGDFAKAIKDLGHNPVVGPEKGIRLTVDWMKEQYRL